jgi:hypothetical protein
MIVFKWKDGRSYISDGRAAANKNGFTHPRTVHLYFEGVQNRFSMYPVRINGVTKDIMPPPPSPYGQSSWSFRPKSYFKTTIDPKKVYIDITYYYSLLFVHNFLPSHYLYIILFQPNFYSSNDFGCIDVSYNVFYKLL